MLSPAALRRCLRARRRGIRNPRVALRESRRAGISYALACSVLLQETGGGANVFGHDPTIFAGAGSVTRRKYLAYRALRHASGNRLMQGVGPMQLTWWSTQDAADREGGCWRVGPNMRVGFRALAANIRRSGLHAGVRAYNGSGPAAERYAETVIARADQLRREGL